MEMERTTGCRYFQLGMIKHLLIVFLSLLPLILPAQQRPIKKYTTNDGLGHSIVYFTTQTKDGALWFSTDNGLTRYDGKAFKNFTAKDGLKSNFVFGLLETDTALLISSFGAGIARYKHGKGVQVCQFQNNVRYPVSIQANKVGLWVTDRERVLYKLNPAGGFSTVKSGDDKLHSFKMIELSSGDILSAGNGIHKYDSQTETFNPLQIEGFPDQIPCNSMLELPGQCLLVATDEAIYKVSMYDLTATEIVKGNFYFLSECLFRDMEGNIWVTNALGEVWLFSPDLKSKELLLSGVIVNHFFQDDLNNIWLSTYGQGVWCIPNIHIKNFPTVAGMLIPDLLFDEDLKKPFIASPNMEITMLHEERIQPADVQYPVFKPKLATTLLHPASGEYLIGTRSTQVYLYRGMAKPADSIKVGGAVASLYKSSSGEYWAGLRTGLEKINSNFQLAEKLNVFEKRFVRSISEDFAGNIMTGTDQGLYIAKGNKWEILNHKNGLQNNYVNVIFKDTTGHCHWIGTNEGISKLIEGEELVNFDHPFVKFRCNSIVNDRNGNIWMATNHGLLMHDRRNFYIYNAEDGLPSDIYKLAYDKVNDYLYVLSSNNLSRIKTINFLQQQSQVIHSVIVNELLADGEAVSDTSQILTFSVPPKYLTLRFSVPHHKNTEGWQVCYRVGENPWAVAQNFGEVSFHDLPFGEFNISIKVVDANKRESPVTIVKVNNPAPIHFKLWFQILFMAVFLFIVAFITKSVVDRLNWKKELRLRKEQQRIILEQKVLRLQMNPHFLFNSLMAIQNFIYKNEPAEAGRYLSEFAKLTRLILENSRQEFITLEREIETLKYYLDLQQLRFMQKFEYHINIDDTIEPELVRIPPMLSQPFIENSIEHGIIHSSESGNILIDYKFETGKLLFTVEDNGIGFNESSRFKKNKEHRSLATTITLERLARFYSWESDLAALSITNVKGEDNMVCGTRVSFYIPVQNSYLNSSNKK
ncbi:histidine kinase [Fulvivirga ulvae]|uniref:sensor histidine kinase n=1 Tax=Fulvivirga ulvae TaxID=2904245 RepID=UPI001F204114|nr:histidine kinase [Fulvivirga ulvae]UII33182.1 histidine kinase [Fulvivirga ulvae]